MAIKCPKCHSDNPDDTIYCGKCATPLKSGEEISITKTLITPAEKLQKGTTIADKYQILEKLGRGGMGVVYKAEDIKLKRTVALKFLPPELTHMPDVKERFMREAQAAAALDHPNICTVYEFDEAEEKTFISMAYVEGHSLKKKIESGPLELDEAMGIALQVAEGLQEAHKKGVVHRDIKSANIMVTEEGQAKIMDFGLARMAGGTLVTKEGMTMGTIAYMSPEQARGEEVDHRTDIWSLGVVLYEIFTGQLPFKGEQDQAVVYSILKEKPKPVTELRSEIPIAIEQVVAKALEKNPDERYQQIDDLLDDLYSLSKGIVHPRIKAAIRRARLAAIKRIYLYGGIVLLSALLIAAGLYFLAFRAEPIDSIAVLPFENKNADPETEYLSDGITDDLIYRLQQLSIFKKVIARSSVFLYKGKEIDPKAVGDELGVDAVLISWMSQRGDKLSVGTELVNTGDRSLIWSNQYERNSSELFSVQKDISNSIIENLRAELTQVERERLSIERAVDPDAHDAYLKALYYRRNWKTIEETYNVLKYCQRAVEIDPDYAQAYELLAYWYNEAGYFGLMPPDECFPKAQEAAMKALTMDETSGVAHAILGSIRLHYDWDLAGAQESVKRAMELNPDNADVLESYSRYLDASGQWEDKQEENIANTKRMIEIDPLNVKWKISLVSRYVGADRYEEAIALARRLIDSKDIISLPYLSGQHNFLAFSYFKKGMYEEAVIENDKAWALVRSSPESTILCGIGHVYGLLGKKEKALKILDQMQGLSSQRYVDPVYFAAVYAGLGDNDKAFDWLEKGYRKHSPNLIYLKNWWALENLCSDTRSNELLKKMGLE